MVSLSACRSVNTNTMSATLLQSPWPCTWELHDETPNRCEPVMLDFNPWVSSHCEVVSLRIQLFENQVWINVYSSQTRKCEKRRLSYGRDWFPKHRVLWNGVVYVAEQYIRYVDHNNSVSGYRIARFGVLDGDPELIEFPVWTKNLSRKTSKCMLGG